MKLAVTVFIYKSNKQNKNKIKQTGFVITFIFTSCQLYETTTNKHSDDQYLNPD